MFLRTHCLSFYLVHSLVSRSAFGQANFSLNSFPKFQLHETENKIVNGLAYSLKKRQLVLQLMDREENSENRRDFFIYMKGGKE